MSTADELQKYKELLDSGAISQEEFDKKKEELLGEKKSEDSNPVFSKYVTDIVAYIGWIGFLLSLCLGTRKESAFHLNQALIINLFALLTCIPFIGSLWAIFMLVCWIIALVSACQKTERKIPLLGNLVIIK